MPTVSLEVLRWAWAYGKCASKIKHDDEYGSYDPLTPWKPGEWEQDNRLLAELKAALDAAEADEKQP